MILKQFFLGCLSHASYLIGDESSHVAAIVDPQRDIDEYLLEAEKQNLKIEHVILTHFHADFVAGHLELAQKLGAKIYLSEAATADYAFSGLLEGDAIDLGSVSLKVLETPGHTPEGISILVYDLQKDKQTPQAVLTGDTLFIGDVGRPDLFEDCGLTAEDLAGMLYDSLRDKLMMLPDETLVYPAHGAGSLCGKNLSSDTCSTIGVQKKLNWALQPMSKETFIANLTCDLPPQPAYFAFDAKLNASNRATLEETLRQSLKPLDGAAVLALKAAGAQLLDCREPQEFATGHIEGSINIGLGGKFATFAGCVLSNGRPIVIICPPGLERQAALRLGRIGFDHVAGFLAVGIGGLEPSAIVSVKRQTVQELASLLNATTPPLVLDVRTKGEREQSAIGGSLHIPLHLLGGNVSKVPLDRPLTVVCAGGYRSSIAASYLRAHGAVNVSDLIGGMSQWVASPVVAAASVSKPVVG